MLLNNLLRRWKLWLESLAEETVIITGVEKRIRDIVVFKDNRITIVGLPLQKIMTEVEDHQKKWVLSRAWESLTTDISGKKSIVQYYKSLKAYQCEVQKIYQEELSNFPMTMVDEGGSYIGRGIQMNGDGSSWIQKGIKDLVHQIYFNLGLDSEDEGDPIKPSFIQKIWPSRFRATLPKNHAEKIIFHQSSVVEKVNMAQCLDEGKQELGYGGFMFRDKAPHIFATFDRTEKNYQRLKQVRINGQKIKQIKENCRDIIQLISSLDPESQTEQIKELRDITIKNYETIRKVRTVPLDYEFNRFENFYHQMILKKDEAMQKFLTRGFIKTSFDDMDEIRINVEIRSWESQNNEIEREMKYCSGQNNTAFWEVKDREIKKQLDDLNNKFDKKEAAANLNRSQQQEALVLKPQNQVAVQESKTSTRTEFSAWTKVTNTLSECLKHFFLRPKSVYSVKVAEDEKVQNAGQAVVPGLTATNGE